MAFDCKKISEKAYFEYVNELESHNQIVKDNRFDNKDPIDQLKELDEFRIVTIKNSIESIFSNMIKVGTSLKENIDKTISSIGKLECDTDLKHIKVEHKCLDRFYKEKEFISYDYSKKIIKNRMERIMSGNEVDDLIDFDEKQTDSSGRKKSAHKISSDITGESSLMDTAADNFDLLGIEEKYEELKDEDVQKDSFDDNKTFVYNSIKGLFEGNDISKIDQLRVFELLHEQYIVKVVANYLHTIKSTREMQDMAVLRSLSDVIKYQLTVGIHDKLNDFELIDAVLGCSQFIYAIDDVHMKKVLLTHWIKDHGVWQDISKWILWIYKAIENRRQEHQDRKSTIHKPNSEDAPEQIKKSAGRWIKGFAKMVIGRTSQADIEEKKTQENTLKSVVFNIMSTYIYHFANFGVTRECGKKLIMYFAEKYTLDQNRTHTLITEFESHQRRGEHILNEREKLMVPLLKRSERLKRYGYDDKTMVIGLWIQYIGDDVTCTNLLGTWKFYNEIFKGNQNFSNFI